MLSLLSAPVCNGCLTLVVEWGCGSFCLYPVVSFTLPAEPLRAFLPGWHQWVSSPAWQGHHQHHFTFPRLQVAASGRPQPPLPAHWWRRTPVNTSHLRCIPYPRAPSEVVTFSLSSIGQSSCQSGSLTLNIVRLSVSLSAEIAVILAARVISREDPHHDEERASRRLQNDLTFKNILIVIYKSSSKYSRWYGQVAAYL